MGTKERKEREKSERRNQIQQAAKELFIQKGFWATTMEDIARKAELSPGTIYLYFRNKEELYASLNVIGLQILTEEVEKIYHNQRLPVEKKIVKYREAMYNVFRRDPLLIRVVLHVQLKDVLLTMEKELLQKLNRLGERVMAMMADTYAEGVRQGKFRKGHPMAHADIIWSTFIGLMLWEEAKKKVNPRKDFLKSTLDRAFDIFHQGIRRERKKENI